MHFRIGVMLDKEQISGETDRIKIMLENGNELYIVEEYGTKRLYITTLNPPLTLEPKAANSVYINIRQIGDKNV